MKSETIVLGGGCFWCIEAVFSKCMGVSKVLSGYAGGEGKASYEEVSGGKTGHAEVVEVTFNPDEIAFEDVLHIFFSVHDPTTVNRQGNDVGTQYRSVIFYNSEEQQQMALKVIADLEAQSLFGPHKIVTQVLPLDKFYEGEDYHQKYYENNAWKPYCQIVIAPKLGKFREKYSKFYKKEGEVSA